MFQLSRKGAQIREMFDTIAPRYDFLNHLLSFGIDIRWRKAAIAGIGCRDGGIILDIATGTGDMALAAAEAVNQSARIVGLDFCENMIRIARTKVAATAYRDRISFGVASCEALPFRDNTFDAATIAFGIRNVVDRGMGLREILRVLTPGGRLVILEFSNPKSTITRTAYHFYLCRLLPFIGGIFSDSRAYRYLPDTVLEFPDQDDFKKMMSAAGFEKTRHADYSFGIVTVYVGEKPSTPFSHIPRP
jgi:demethylmenaquinone methyltransferase / 2-methoxy-6-polyprenyl-1,4-benzoquinol methylase